MKLDPVPLTQLAAVSSGGGAPQEASAFGRSGYPFVRAGSLPKLLDGEGEDSLEKLEPNVAENYGLKLFPPDTVLFAKSGMSATKGHVYRLRGDAYVVNHLAALVPHDPSDARFLERALPSFSPTFLIRDLAYPSIRLRDIERMRILAPSDPKDRRWIAEILDKADVLRAKRRAALSHLESLIKSIFLEMFGDPPRDWTMTDIANIANPERGAVRTGPFGSQLLHSEFTDHGVAVLGIDNAVANEFRWGDRRYISESKYHQLKRYTVHPGDVLITIMGTCGRCAVVPDDIPRAINTKHLCCITLDPEKCLPVFLHSYFLRHPIAHRYLSQNSKGAIMSGLNMGIIKQMPVPLPPLQLQRDFGRRVVALEELKKAHCRSLSALDALFASLQHRAFRGEL